jgi:hypothetical protein
VKTINWNLLAVAAVSSRAPPFSSFVQVCSTKEGQYAEVGITAFWMVAALLQKRYNYNLFVSVTFESAAVLDSIKRAAGAIK